MSITSNILEALFLNNSNFWLTIEDIRDATVQEVLLYYAYNRVINRRFALDKKLFTKKDQQNDAMIIAYFIFCAEPDIPIDISANAKYDLIYYSNEYSIFSYCIPEVIKQSVIRSHTGLVKSPN